MLTSFLPLTKYLNKLQDLQFGNPKNFIYINVFFFILFSAFNVIPFWGTHIPYLSITLSTNQ